jgi:hypothetical protein
MTGFGRRVGLEGGIVEGRDNRNWILRAAAAVVAVVVVAVVMVRAGGRQGEEALEVVLRQVWQRPLAEHLYLCRRRR